MLGVIVIKGSKSNEVKKYILQENYGKQIITGVLAIQERQKCMVAVDTFNCTCLILAFNLPMALPFLHFLPLHIVSHFKSLMVVRFPSQPRPQGFSLLIFLGKSPGDEVVPKWHMGWYTQRTQSNKLIIVITRSNQWLGGVLLRATITGQKAMKYNCMSHIHYGKHST